MRRSRCPQHCSLDQSAISWDACRLGQVGSWIVGASRFCRRMRGFRVRADDEDLPVAESPEADGTFSNLWFERRGRVSFLRLTAGGIPCKYSQAVILSGTHGMRLESSWRSLLSLLRLLSHSCA